MADKEAQNIKKTEWHLVPMELLITVVEVLMDGKYRPRPHNNNKPYGANNWRSGKPFRKEEVLNAAQRHLTALQCGEEIDEVEKGGVGSPHWANVICEMLFYGWYEKYGLWNKKDSEMLTELAPIVVHHKTVPFPEGTVVTAEIDGTVEEGADSAPSQDPDFAAIRQLIEQAKAEEDSTPEVVQAKFLDRVSKKLRLSK